MPNMGEEYNDDGGAVDSNDNQVVSNHPSDIEPAPLANFEEPLRTSSPAAAQAYQDADEYARHMMRMHGNDSVMDGPATDMTFKNFDH